jgi:phytoene synthase
MSLLLSGAAEQVGHVGLAESRAFCERLTRTQARNFYYGLKLLPEPKRSAMFALYAYMRLVDDIADQETDAPGQGHHPLGRPLVQRQAELEAWREQTHAILDARSPTDSHALWPAFAEMVAQYRMPRHIFDDVIAGQQQDLDYEPPATFEQLHRYCYRVAGVVGLASIYVWGFEGGAQTEALAIDRGLAFQLTNILRDLREDAQRGRTYLPLDELAGHGISEEDLRSGSGGTRFGELMRFQIERAESYYERSSPLEDRIQRDSRPTLIAMTQIYHRLLKKVAAEPARVLRERVSLSLATKLMIGWRASRGR